MTNRVEMTVTEVDEAPEQSTGNRLKFKLDFMLMMVSVGRDAEASNMYEKLVEEFDKLA